MPFKIIEKSQNKTNIGLWETKVLIKLPKRYEKLDPKAVDDININHITCESGLLLSQEDGGAYLMSFDLTKKKIDIEKFIQKSKEQFWSAFNKWKEEQKNDN